MVKLKGPMSSAEASGSLGQAATFSSWKGRAYARAKVVPTNPKSDAQTSVRAMLGFLSQQWAALSVANKATWDEAAALSEVAPYSAYLSHNLDRWRQFHAPGKVWPVLEAGTLPTSFGYTASGKKAHIHFSFTWSPRADGWAVLLFHSLATGFTPSRANLLHVHLITTDWNDKWEWHTTQLGTHYFNIRYFTTTGKLSTAFGQVAANVT